MDKKGVIKLGVVIILVVFLFIMISQVKVLSSSEDRSLSGRVIEDVGSMNVMDFEEDSSKELLSLIQGGDKVCIVYPTYTECKQNGEKSLEVYEYRYQDNFGNWKTYRENIILKRQGRDINITLNDKFSFILEVVPLLNNEEQTWQQISSVHQNLKHEVEIYDFENGGIKFDLNLTNGKSIGQDLPADVGLKLNLNGIDSKDIEVLNDGLLFFGEYKLWFPEDCVDITKTSITYEVLNKRCLDPSLNVSTSIELGGDLDYDEVTVYEGGIIVINQSFGYLNISADSIDVRGQINGMGRNNYTGGSGGSGSAGGCATADPGGTGNSPAGGGNGGTGGGGGSGCNPGTGGSGGIGATTPGTIDSRVELYQGGSSGGGGAGTWSNSAEGSSSGDPGPRGGGAVRLNAPIIYINGSIDMSGNRNNYGGFGGLDGGAGGGGGGGSSGGTILIDGYLINISNSQLNASGGNGGIGQVSSGAGARGFNGGIGEGGRIKIFYNSLENFTTIGIAETIYYEGVNITCDIPDGSSYDGGCHCVNDSDCSVGYCEESPGPDGCVVQSYCNGTINVFVEDSFENPIEDAYVYLNITSKGQTDDAGFKVIDVENVTCLSSHNVQVKCDDDSTVCDTDSAIINNGVDSMTFVCDVCTSVEDLFVGLDDIEFEEQAGQINVSVIVHTVGIEASNVDVNLIKKCGGVYSISTEVISSVTSSNNYEVSFLENLDNCEKVGIHVDPYNEVDENDLESNNYVELLINQPVKVYLEVNTGYSYVDDVIRDFIEDEGGVQVVSEGDSELNIYVGRKADISAIRNEGWLVNNVIEFNGQREGLPYNGFIGKITSGKPKLYVFGNEIDGTIASVRRLIEDRKIYLNEETLNDPINNIYLDETNIDAISVFDYLHTVENQEKYRKNTGYWAGVVYNILRRSTFDLSIKRVMTSNVENVSLRMKYINSDLSPNFKSYVGGRPVVIARGLWSNLFNGEEFGREIATGKGTSTPRDTWLIEITGGPNTECDNCPNYDFDDLTDYYWPALIAGVEVYSGENEIDYVGHSNGCRTALVSLEKYQASGKNNAGFYVNDSGDWESIDMSANVVDTFVGIGCPGAFEGSSQLKPILVSFGGSAVKKLESKGVLHPTMDQVFYFIPNMIAKRLFPSDYGISLNLFEDYVNFAKDTSDPQPGNFNVDKVAIIGGLFPFSIGTSPFSDGIVSLEDVDDIYDNINSNDKKQIIIFGDHISIADSETSKKLTKKILNDEEFSWWENFYVVEES